MILFDEYKAEVEKHIQNKDYFLVKSLIRDDDKAIPNRIIQRITMDMKNSGSQSGRESSDKIECFSTGRIDAFNKEICRHRYSYVCELIDFYNTMEDHEYSFYFRLKVKIVKVIDNPMNIPQIKEGNIISLYNYFQNMSLSVTCIARSYSMFYKKMDDENSIYTQIEEYDDLLPSKGFFYLEMKRYEPESS